MAIAVESSGTQVTVGATDHTLAAPTTAKTRVLVLDAVNLVTTATLDVTIRSRVLSGGTLRNAYTSAFSGFSLKDEPILISIPIPQAFGGDFIIRCSAAISIDWTILVLD